MMHLPILVVTIFTVAFQYKCLAYTVMHDTDEDYSVSLSPQNNINKFIERSNQPESRLIPIITFNPFNKHQNQNSLAVNAATQQQLDQIKKDLQTLQNAYKKVKPVYPDIVKLYKNLQALNTKLKAQGITVSKVVDNAKTIKETLPGCHKTGAKVLGTFCYWIVTDAANFATASTSCRADGGILAEPSYEFSPKLYTALKNAFPTQINTVGTKGMWIGVDNYYDPDPKADDKESSYFRNNFIYLSTNERVPNAPAQTTHGNLQRGTLLGTNVQWSSELATIVHAYLCQSPSLSKSSVV